MLVTGVGAALDDHRRPAAAAAAAAGPSALVAVPEAAADPGGAPVDLDPTNPSPPAAPIAVEAPGVGIAAPLVSVGKTPDGALDVPDFGSAGWYEHSVVPGAPGAAVLAGHVDSTTGPDVFHRLEELQPGDEVLVRHADGATSSFVVHGREVVDKDELPVDRIFDQPGRPELRVITCGGAFDRGTRSYESNVIVYASLRDHRAAAG